jgi:hypothetical protein
MLWGILGREGVAGEDEQVSDVRESAAILRLDSIIRQETVLPPFPGPPR